MFVRQLQDKFSLAYALDDANKLMVCKIHRCHNIGYRCYALYKLLFISIVSLRHCVTRRI